MGTERRETEGNGPFYDGENEERPKSPQFRVRVFKVIQQDTSLYRRPKEDSMRHEFQALFGSEPSAYQAAQP